MTYFPFESNFCVKGFHSSKLCDRQIPSSWCCESRVWDIGTCLQLELNIAQCLEETLKMEPIIDFFTLNLHFEWLLKNHQLSILIISSKTFSIWGKGRLRETKTNKINKNWQIRIEKVQILHTISTDLTFNLWIRLKQIDLNFQIFKSFFGMKYFQTSFKYWVLPI